MKQYLTLALASVATATSLEIPGFQRSLDDIINQLRSSQVAPRHNFQKSNVYQDTFSAEGIVRVSSESECPMGKEFD